MAACLINGEPESAVSALDRGLAFGDGVFRTMRVTQGRCLNWDRHFRRLAFDCAALGLPVPAEPLLHAEIRRLAPGDASVKLIVTRGESTRGYSMTPEALPTRIVLAFPPPPYPPELAREGVRVRRCQLVLAEQARLAGVKTLNRLENVLARAEWFDSGIREGLLCDAAGRLIEGTMANLFVVGEAGLATPDLSRCGVIGAQRERLRELAAGAGMACAIRDIPVTELGAAREVFLCNSLIGIWPVTRFEELTWRVGPVTRRLQGLLADDDARAP